MAEIVKTAGVVRRSVGLVCRNLLVVENLDSKTHLLYISIGHEQK